MHDEDGWGRGVFGNYDTGIVRVGWEGIKVCYALGRPVV